MLYRDLVTPHQLARILGHATTEMVYNVYVAYIENNKADLDRSISLYVR
jgi:hypothetical protein